jgi:serine/threonine protein kinase
VSLATLRREVAEELRHAFLNEIRMAKRLAATSKHIVHMYDFDFDHNGWTYIVMELGQQDLEKALSNRPPLSSAERKAMWRQLVNIAITLHHHQIVSSFHRDFI